jgi:hypothetical protein
MIQTKIAGAVAALALLAAPAVAAAHDSGHGHGRHHHKHHAKKKAQAREVTGTATATVASFTNGELTLALTNGKSFSALVTDRTVIKCKTVAPAKATNSRHGDHGAKGDDNGDGRCGTTALVAGAKVTQAKLSLKGGDATWKKVELIQ